MNTFTKSVSFIVPLAQVADANRLLEWLGRGPGNFSVPLSPTGTDPITHYGCHIYDDELFTIITTKTLPVNLLFSTLGMSKVRANAVLNAVKHKAVPDTAGAVNFDALIAENSLQKVVLFDPDNPYQDEV